MSIERVSAEEGGDLGWISAGMIAVFDSVVVGLDPGEVSTPFWSTSGFEILKLNDWREASNMSFEEAAPRMRMSITSVKADELLSEWVENRKAEVGYRVNEDLLRDSKFPPPAYKAKRLAYEKRQESEEEPVLPKIVR